MKSFSELKGVSHTEPKHKGTATMTTERTKEYRRAYMKKKYYNMTAEKREKEKARFRIYWSEKWKKMTEEEKKTYRIKRNARVRERRKKIREQKKQGKSPERVRVPVNADNKNERGDMVMGEMRTEAHKIRTAMIDNNIAVGTKIKIEGNTELGTAKKNKENENVVKEGQKRTCHVVRREEKKLMNKRANGKKKAQGMRKDEKNYAEIDERNMIKRSRRTRSRRERKEDGTQTERENLLNYYHLRNRVEIKQVVEL